jgi:hypothetical protein
MIIERNDNFSELLIEVICDNFESSLDELNPYAIFHEGDKVYYYLYK